MPRKVSYGIDYDDSYDDDYDDYGYDYEDNAAPRGHGTPAPSEKKTENWQKLWQCSICTYENDESLPFCDICGAVRNADGKSHINNLETADGTCKSYGVSKMANSLFAPMPCGTGKAAIPFQPLDDALTEEAFRDQNVPQNFSELQRFFMAPQQNHRISIAPFKFDSPSPDEIVFAAKSAPKGLPKDPSRGVTSNAEKKTNARNLTSSEKPESSSGSLLRASYLEASGNSNATGKKEKIAAIAADIQDLRLGKGRDKGSSGISQEVRELRYEPEKWMSNTEKGTLKQLNMAIVGHVDSGKSTLSGRLLHLLGRISKKEMHKYEKEAKEKGKGSFSYAFAMDESSEERERGITMTVAIAYFDTKKYHVVLLDSPGHKDFVPNMISGSSQADAAILVVDASTGSFEAGMDGFGIGQTKEHAQLVRSFGVEQLVVVINKMDAVGYSKERFDVIKSQLSSFLRSCQFKESLITWIPASAMENENLIRAPSDPRLTSWYGGPCVLEAIDSLQPPERDTSKPLRLPICDVIRSPSLGQVAASGKLETGAIKNGSKVLVMPSREVATVRSIERDSQTCSIARAGDNVAVSLQGIDYNNLSAGGVLCHPDFPVTVGTHLELKIYVLNITVPILVGYQIEFLIHHAKEAGRIAKITSVLDQKTKAISKKAPRFLTAKQSAVVEVVLERAVCVEEFSKCRPLGRAFLRASGNTVAVGTVTRIIS